jgi:zinc transport system substrate-binding protein
LPCALAAAVAVSCAKAPRKVAPATGHVERPRVVWATTYPLAYFAERIGGDHVKVVCPVPPDEDPQFWRPDRETVLEMQGAALILMNGAGLEKWTETAFLPLTRTVETARPLKSDLIKLEHVVTHSHGPAGKHSHKGLDGYTWVDPINAIAQAREVAKAMGRAFPLHKDDFDAGIRSLIGDLQGLDRTLVALSKGQEGRVLLTSHPFYNYIARRYGWSIGSLLLEVDKMPSDSEFISLQTIVEKTGARLLVWEAPPRADIAAEMSKRLGLKSVVFSPCATLDEEDRVAGRDYLKMMLANARNIREVFAAPE